MANKKHAASWHGWGLLEKREGNLVKARDLWLKVRLFRSVQDLLPPKDPLKGSILALRVWNIAATRQYDLMDACLLFAPLCLWEYIFWESRFWELCLLLSKGPCCHLMSRPASWQNGPLCLGEACHFYAGMLSL